MANIDERRANLDRLMKGGTQGEVLTCEACGGTYFYQASCAQYASGGYGSVEYTIIGNNPKDARVCLCGMPLPTKNMARGVAAIRGIQEEYIRSLSVARAFIEANNIKNLAKAAVSPAEVEEVKSMLLAKLEAVQEAIAELNAKQHTSAPKGPKKTTPNAAVNTA